MKAWEIFMCSTIALGLLLVSFVLGQCSRTDDRWYTIQCVKAGGEWKENSCVKGKP